MKKKSLEWTIKHQLFGFPEELRLDNNFFIRLPKPKFNQITKNLATIGLCCTIPKDWIIVDVYYDLNDDDRRVNKVKSKIIRVTSLLQNNKKVCVRCAMGINRSNTIALAALVYLDKSRIDLEAKWLKWRKTVYSKVDRAWMSSILSATCLQAIRELNCSQSVDKNHICRTGTTERLNNRMSILVSGS